MPFIYNQYFRNKFPPYIFVNTIIFLAQLLGKLGWVWFSFLKKWQFQKVRYKTEFFLKAERLLKTVNFFFFKKIII